jgi:Protein of unknown function (DUF4238)
MSTEVLETNPNCGPARKANPKNHHYVPRFYLAQFASTQAGENKPGLWMFARGQNGPKRIPPVQIARIHQYYAFPSDGGYDTRPEMLFGEIESRTAGIFERFNRGEYELTQDEIESFSYFVALMLVRIPADRVEVEGGFAPKLDQFRARFPEEYRARMAGFAEDCGTFDENSLRDKLIASYSLTRIIGDIPKTATVLRAHNWFIHKTASKQGFITSDRPALYHPKDKENPVGYVSMPLSPTSHFVSRPKLALLRRINSKHPLRTHDEVVTHLEGAEPTIRVSRAEPRQIRFANQMIIDHAFKYVFARSFDPSLYRAITRRLD